MNLPASGGRDEARRARAVGLALLLVWFVLLLLPAGRLAELPLLVAAVLGVLALRRARGRIGVGAGFGLLLVVFAGYWLPMLLSATDAVAPRKAWTEVLADLRFLPFAAFVVLLVGGHDRRLARLYGLTAAVVALWTLDALMQAVTGWSLGGALTSDRVSGIFGADDLKLGPVLAVLSPFLLFEALERYGRRGLAVAWLALCAAILLAGARAGWIMFALVTVVTVARLAHGWRQGVLLLGGATALALTLAVVGYLASPTFAARVDRTAGLLAGDVGAVDHALAGRLPIFRTAVAMAEAHPWNGVGVRGFRHAYPDYAAPGDPWVSADGATGALHPHHLVLEIAAETGLLGLACWLVAVALAWRAHARLERARRHLAHPPALALAALLFPLNTHFAVYSSFWGLLFWWVLALFLATVSVPRTATERGA